MKGMIFKTWPDKFRVLKELGEAETRRVIKPQPQRHKVHIDHSPRRFSWTSDDLVELKDGGLAEINSPAGLRLARYKVREIVYVKEAWRLGAYNYKQAKATIGVMKTLL